MRSWIPKFPLRRSRTARTAPTLPKAPPDDIVFHITHWKSGSQWVRGVLNRLVSDRIVVADGDMANVRDDVLRQGAVYTPVYMAAQWFDQQVTPRPHHRHLVVIRDLRDAAVSWYFSMKYSHGVINDAVAESRRTLDDLSMEEGLLFVIRERLRGMADIQRSWLHKPECRKLIIRYEDLVADEVGQFNQIFDFAGFDSDIVVRRVAIEAESFQARTGRARGVESVREHHRKGVAGDWQNHFTDRVKDAFKSMYGQTLIETGYESDLNW